MGKNKVVIAVSVSAVIVVSSAALVSAKNMSVGSIQNAKCLSVATTHAGNQYNDESDSKNKRSATRVRACEPGKIDGLLSDVTGLSVEEVQSKIQRGATPWQIVKDADKLDEYKEAMKENMAARLDDLVEEGVLTHEKANAMLSDFDENLACANPSVYRTYDDSQANMQYGNGYGRPMRGCMRSSL